MRQYGKTFWRSVPFLRLLIPLTAGILTGFNYPLPLPVVLICAIVAAVAFLLFRFLPNAAKYRRRWINGTFLNLVFISMGILLCYRNDVRQQKNWIGGFDSSKAVISVTLLEPVTEKERSYKATANVAFVMSNNKWQAARGKLLLYFAKDSIAAKLVYGSRILIHTDLRLIRNTGNPGSFNYQQYCAFQGIYHQVYLKPDSYQVVPGSYKRSLAGVLYKTRAAILSILKRYIPGNKEAGVAEALLIGYRNDLDRDLVQAYSNTGVVHIIAISGLHLGMIYGLLIAAFSKIPKNRFTLLLRPLCVLFVLWGFSLLTGASASILRSAVMFSFIVTGESLGRRTNIYNTLAASAFCLLFYDPFFLWDVGFLLSYTAVLSIVLFMKPIYQWLYIKNKFLNTIWQLNSVTLSAQLLTLPLVLFCFHQFPNLFLFTNAVAVPLSGLILYAELLLLIIAPFSFINVFTGKTISFLIAQLNGYIERTASLPFSVTDNIHLSLLQGILLYLALIAFAWWLFHKQAKAFCWGSLCIVAYLLADSLHRIRSRQQQKLVVYNTPRQTAIDIIEGRYYRCIGDSIAYTAQSERFYLRPARILFGVQPGKILPYTYLSRQLIATRRTRALIISHWEQQEPQPVKIPVEIIILCGNPRLTIYQLTTVFNCTQYVFDSSNPLWKIQQWKKEADSLHLRHHSTSEQGAFEVDL